MRKRYPFEILNPEFKPDSRKENDMALQKEAEEKKALPAQNNTLNMVKFEDCDFENVTIILNFEAPD